MGKPWTVTADKFLSDDQILQLDMYLKDRRDLSISRGCNDKQAIKEYYLIHTILGTGARVFEFAALKEQDFNGLKLSVRIGKGKKPRGLGRIKRLF